MPPTFMEKISRRFILLLVTLLSLVPARTQAQAAHAMDNPALAIGLSGVADWSTQNPFIDLMKTARPWIGHRPGQHGGMDFEALQAGGYIDPQGWPIAVPRGIEALETFILTEQPAEATGL